MSRWRWALIVAVAVAITAAWWWRTPPPPRSATPLPAVAPAPYGQLEAPPAMPLPEPEPEPVISGAEAAERLAGPNGIVCRLEPAVSGGAARLVPDSPDPDWLAVALVGAGYLVLSDVPPTGEGTLRVEGFAPVDLRWDEALEGPVGLGDCAPSPVVLQPAEAAIVGVVAGAEGRASLVSVEACGQRAPLQDDGSFYLAVADGETCDVIARRHLGVLDYASPPVEVTARAGHDSVVELAVPDVEAVVPIVLEEGLVVGAVWDELDLRPGERIVGVDGQPAPPDLVDFYTTSGGPRGEVVVLQVEGDDGPREVEVSLKVLGFDDWLVNE